MPKVSEQRCNTCGVVKTADSFNRSAQRTSGLQPKCRQCFKSYNEARYAAEPERYREKARAWRASHLEMAIARSRLWQSQHREHVRQYDHARRTGRPAGFYAGEWLRRRAYHDRYRMLNAEKVQAKGRRWRIENPDKNCEKQSRRRARLQLAERIDKVDRASLIKRDNSTCYLCGLILTDKQVTLDHVVPLARGGSHTAENLRVACGPCNSRKGTRLIT